MPVSGKFFQLGFEIHHAKPEYIQLTHWLPTSEPNMLPRYASNYIGERDASWTEIDLSAQVLVRL